MSWETELQNARRRWLEAKKKGDRASMSLWEKYGNFVKRKIKERMGITDLYEQAKEIFNQK
jgi:hypothetical protein